ncbi:hypothetical protein [Streptomyces flaveolus]|uniref:hypothetical protein n=1 Tax=Streptomyces flaveolus TaxID=67297 RepID=UPI0033297BA5
MEATCREGQPSPGAVSEIIEIGLAEAGTGVSLAEACDRPVREHGAGVRPGASRGDYDRHRFVRQCAAERVAHPFGMAQALEIAGLPLERRHHRGSPAHGLRPRDRC